MAYRIWLVSVTGNSLGGGGRVDDRACTTWWTLVVLLLDLIIKGSGKRKSESIRRGYDEQPHEGELRRGTGGKTTTSGKKEFYDVLGPPG
jgi:hypothetical protein